MTTIVEIAFAKVNLWLEILGKRADGYHEIETVMHEVDLFDRVSLSTAAEFAFSVDDPDVGTGEDNLAVKALRAVESFVGKSLPCQIRLQKCIPAGGGLGGGSSDAAAVVRGLNSLFDLKLSINEMEGISAEFGSDTSFFIRGGTAMCRGRGELIEPLTAPKDLIFVLVFPGLHVPTGPIFQALQLTHPPKSPYAFLKELSSENVDSLRPQLFNRLEGAAKKVHPDLAQLLTKLEPLGFMMSGSGSTLFQLATDHGPAQEMAEAIERAHGVRAQVVTSAVRS